MLDFDLRRPSWNQFSAISTKEMRPSFAYIRAQNDMRTSWSWDLLRCNFPESLKYNFTVSKIEIPTPDELNHIDDLWAAIQSQSVNNINKKELLPW